MFLRGAAIMALVGLIAPATAEELKPDEARRFVAGKLFSYTCFEGTTGAGRIHADGSVAGTIQIGGQGPVRHVTLPSNTIRLNPDSICASVRGVPFQPCFNLVKTDAKSFRGSLSGFGFAYCDFVRLNPRLTVASVARGKPRRVRAPRPLHSAVVLRPSQD
ncbi:hypothetical protein RA307_05075 [Xanthobacteraceae bacterium Astr-EGSB]|uniref:hypothetical protein n=1 Tax=Astrobacterium formosum TaxID=3069710 RepID=UPI0027B627FA|nr:hypothetical protein [Xanthobacteraceae bacterium Astr-EGSB]